MKKSVWFTLAIPFFLAQFGTASANLPAYYVGRDCSDLLVSREEFSDFQDYEFRIETPRLVVLAYFGAAVFERENRVQVGSINGVGERMPLGFEEYARGRGYATEAKFALIKTAFEYRGVENIVAFVSPGNIPSIKLHEKLGFEIESRDPFLTYVLTPERFGIVEDRIAKELDGDLVAFSKPRRAQPFADFVEVGLYRRRSDGALIDYRPDYLVRHLSPVARHLLVLTSLWVVRRVVKSARLLSESERQAIEKQMKFLAAQPGVLDEFDSLVMTDGNHRSVYNFLNKFSPGAMDSVSKLFPKGENGERRFILLQLEEFKNLRPE